MKKLIIIIELIIFMLILGIRNVLADDVLPLRERLIPNTFGVSEGSDRTRLYHAYIYFINNEVVYCIEPGVPVTVDSYFRSTDFSKINLSEDVLNKIRLIAYYGHSYNIGPHLNDRYFLASQELIWETISGRDTYWVSEEDINGKRIDVEKEKNEIERLIAEHSKLPSFHNKEITIKLGETYKLVDDNNVLSKFKLEGNSDIVKINGNTIEIIPTKLSDSKVINLISKLYTDKVNYLFYNGESQKFMSATSKIDPVKSLFKINVVVNPKVKVIKTDMITKDRVKLAGIKFKIKNLDNNKYICENSECIFETDINGEFMTKSELTYGNYQVEELEQTIKGYLFNNEPLKFTIDKNSNFIDNNGNTYVEYKFENKPLLGSIQINKIGEVFNYQDGVFNYSFSNLDDVKFDLYAKEDIYLNNVLKYKKDELVKEIIIKDGIGVADNIPLGDYYLKEVLAPSKYIISDIEYPVKLSQTNSTDKVNISLTIKNYLAKGSFEITKYDKDTNLPLSNVEISIYNDRDILLYTGLTDEVGKIVVDNLPIGKYYYQETRALNDYVIDSNKYYFEITKNDETVNANLINEKVKVPDTGLDKNNYLDIFSIVSLIFGGILLVCSKN